MKKSKWIPLCLAALSLATCALSACKETPSDSSSVGDVGVFDPLAKPIQKDIYQGTHVLTAPDTDTLFFENGVCNYTVVVPDAFSKPLTLAKDELVRFFQEATGIALSVVTESSWQGGGKFISLGETTLLQESGIEIDKETLSRDGVRIVTKDDNIYLAGGSDYGALYAVYTFLEIYFDFDVYYKDCYEILRGVKTAKLKAFDVTDIPDLEFRSNGYYSLITEEWAYRFRYPQTYSNITFPIREDVNDPASPARGVHNSMHWLPRNQYFETHSEWFESGGRDLCYTAHGDEEEYQLMIETCAEKALATLRVFNKNDYPDYRILNFTQQDAYYNCGCETCLDYKRYYGTDAAAIVLFMNDLREAIDQGMKELSEDCQREDLTLTFFAYQWSEQAPKTGFDEMYLRDGVSVYLATADTFDAQSSIYTDKNKVGRDNLKAWAEYSDEILLWTYSTKFSHYLFPVDTFSFYNEDAFSFFAANNVKLMYNQSQVTQKGTTTAWHNLKAYLDSKLEWDSSRSANEYIDKYMSAMFGKAAPYMKKMYQDVRLQAGIVKTKYDGTTVIGSATNLKTPDFWPFMTVKQWLATLDLAYDAIEEYRYAAPAEYEKYKLHIDAEWISPAYMLLSFYSDLVAPDELNAIKAKFRQVAQDTGITNTHEVGTGQITSFVASL